MIYTNEQFIASAEPSVAGLTLAALIEKQEDRFSMKKGSHNSLEMTDEYTEISGAVYYSKHVVLDEINCYATGDLSILSPKEIQLVYQALKFKFDNLEYENQLRLRKKFEMAYSKQPAARS